MRSRARAAWQITKLAFRADAKAATAAAVLGVLGGVFAMVSTALLARTMQHVIGGELRDATVSVVAMVALGRVNYAISMLELDLRFRLTDLVAQLIDGELIERMTNHAGLDLHERPANYDRLEILRKQVGAVSQTVGALIHNVSTWTGLLSTTALLVTVHPALVLLPLLGIPPVLLGGRAENAWNDAVDASSERLRRANHLYELASTAAPAKELRTFGVAEEIVDRHGALLRDAYDEISTTQLRWGVLTSVAWALYGIGELVAIAFTTSRAISGDASIADVVLTVSIAGSMHGYLQQIHSMVSWLYGTLRAAERYVDVIDAADAVETPGPWEPAPVPRTLQRGIELDGVSFRYPEAAGDTLRDVSVLLPAGSTVALVGENGAGKSTLIKLLGRYYLPTEGAIRVDGVDLARMDPVEWRARLSGAFQDHARFELVAREVVGVGDLDLIGEERAIVDALSRAGGGELPDRLDRGLETPLGRSFEAGVEPSGGQWQQLALGRALLRSGPLLLLLDEPTSALDPEAEHTLFEGYANAARTVAAETGAITLLVSHRFSTVRMADLIVVVEDGTVTQAGTHDELIAAGGTYADLYALQARAYG